jgi:integrase
MVSRASNGRGNIYHRKDGRYSVSVWMLLPDGSKKRSYATTKTKSEAEQLLHDKLDDVRRGIPTPTHEFRVGEYLNYWLAEVVTAKNRPSTVALYDMYIRLYLAPILGRKHLRELSVSDVQRVLNTIAQSKSIRLAHGTRTVLRAALNRAIREQLLTRNVASLTELPTWERKKITPWSVDEANAFLRAATPSPWHLAYQLLITYGMRRGEVLGLRWKDLDLERGTLSIEQQLLRVAGELQFGPVKTSAGRRTLPVLSRTRSAMVGHLTQRARSDGRLEAEILQSDELIFTSKLGTPIDPKNFVRSFHLICDNAKIRRITVHHLRHTTATLLKNLGVPARDAQLILGHAQVTTTQQLYQHADIEGQSKAMEQVERQLLAENASARSGQNWWSNVKSADKIGEFLEYNLGGTSGIRTHDSLLKSFSGLPSNALPTSVLRGIRTLTRAYKLGRAVVKIGGQTRARRKPISTNFIDGWKYFQRTSAESTAFGGLNLD